MMRFGSIEQFCESETTWNSYVEQKEQVFMVNDISEHKKSVFLLMFIGQKSYDVLNDICQPDKSGNKS